MATNTTPGYVSNSDLASRISALIDKWNGYKNALRDMLTKATGTVDMEDGTGAVVTLPTFPALKKNVQDMLDSGTGAVAAAQASASAAAGSASDSSGYAQDSLQHANAAASSAENAAAHASDASESAAASAASSVEADGAAERASTSASTAESMKADAAASAASALVAQAASAASETAAAASASAASGSSDEARSWALSAQTTVTGLLHYVPGGWDASSGTFPSDPRTGDFYKITVAGTVDGEDLQVGDQIIYSGSGWDHIDNTENVTAVAGKVGNVSLGIADIGGLQGSLDAKADSSSPTINGTLKITNGSITTELDAAARLSYNGSAFKSIWTAANFDPSTKADLSGANFTGNINAAAVTTSGFIQSGLAGAEGTYRFGVDDWYIFSSTSGMGWYSTSKGLGLRLDKQSKQVSVSGSIASDGSISANTNFLSNNTYVVVATSGPGAILLRPRGVSDGTTQVTIDSNASLSTPGTIQANGFYVGQSQVLWDNGVRVNDNLRVAATLFQVSANGAAWVRTPRTFVQAGDPGAWASDGDLWIY